MKHEYRMFFNTHVSCISIHFFINGSQIPGQQQIQYKLNIIAMVIPSQGCSQITVSWLLPCLGDQYAMPMYSKWMHPQKFRQLVFETTVYNFQGRKVKTQKEKLDLCHTV